MLSREQSVGVNVVQQGINGETHARAHEASDTDWHGNVANEDGDVDLFGDDGDADGYIKPYATPELTQGAV